MPEPDDEFVKDDDGWTWVHTCRGWSLMNHDQLCYQDLSWRQVEDEYGPMHLMDN